MKETKRLMRTVVSEYGVKASHIDTGIATHLLYGWTSETNDGKYRKNPIDMVQALCESSGNEEIIHYLCNQFGGSFVKASSEVTTESGLLKQANRVVRDLSKAMAEITESVDNDGIVTNDEAKMIRRAWNTAMCKGEGFVRGAEAGIYDGSGR